MICSYIALRTSVVVVVDEEGSSSSLFFARCDGDESFVGSN